MSLKEFVKIAVALREHPKVLHAGDDGGWLYVCAIMWSKEHDTDGFIPEHVVPRLTGLKQPLKVVAKCVTAGLLEVVDGGWAIHDYLEVQESSEARKAAGRKAATVRWERARAMRNGYESHANGNANAVRGRNTEEEEEEEKTPPNPPQAGGVCPAPLIGGRARDRTAIETQIASFVAEHFPGVPAGLVTHCAAQLRSAKREPTVAALRPLIQQHTGGIAA